LPAFALCVLLLLLAATAQAIVVRHDIADSRYVVDARRYPQFFWLHSRNGKPVCMATLIAARWAITAAHCTEETPIGETLAGARAYALEVNGARYDIAELVVHPEYLSGALLRGVDLALIRLDRAVPDIAPVKLNHARDELAKAATLLGWGHTGIGTIGRQGNDGKLRRAHNSVSEVSQWLSFRFDDPRVPGNEALSLEGVPGLGDSGGPALLETGEGLLLMGVALGELESAAGRDQQGRYGAIEIYERISLHLDWIGATLGADLPAATP
jgi:secreted trypsin-like serine protease